MGNGIPRFISVGPGAKELRQEDFLKVKLFITTKLWQQAYKDKLTETKCVYFRILQLCLYSK